MNLFSDPVFIRYCTYVQGAWLQICSGLAEGN